MCITVNCWATCIYSYVVRVNWFKFFLLSRKTVVYEKCHFQLLRFLNFKKIFPKSKIAKESDWYREYLGPVLAVKIVKSLDDAISHISKYGSMHTDAIISQDKHAIKIFMQKVDSSSVMVNTSTRFADGFEYGLGAEIGISTDKLHARGPVGLIGLTNQKYIVTSKGKTR